MKIYNALPIWGQNFACDFEGYRIERSRYPENFEELLRTFQSHDSMSLEAVQKFQVDKLRKLFIHCQERVPYYTDLFKRIGFKAEKFNSLEQIKELPLLTKTDVNRDYDKFLTRGVKEKDCLVIYTGGTTGESLKELKSNEEEANKWAVWWRYRYRLGIKRDTVEARFASNQVVPTRQDKPPYWRENKPGKVVIYSQYHLNRDTVVDYVEDLKKRHIQWIHGYASIIANLANLMNEKGIKLEITHITVGAENLYESQKKAIKNAFGVEPFQHYGNTEGVANFSQYPDGKIRIDEDFSYVEFEYRDGKNLVVGTNLYNYVMPFIRYSTGDCAELSDEQDGGFRIISNIIGREGEYIVTGSGAHISAEALDSRVFAYIPHLGDVQIRQESVEKIDVNIIPLEGFVSDDECMLENKLKEVVGYDMKLDIHKVSELEKSKNGKHRLVISNV